MKRKDDGPCSLKATNDRTKSIACRKPGAWRRRSGPESSVYNGSSKEGRGWRESRQAFWTSFSQKQANGPPMTISCKTVSGYRSMSHRQGLRLVRIANFVGRIRKPTLTLVDTTV